MKMYRFKVLGGLLERTGSLQEVLAAMLDRAVVDCEDCDHFQITDDEARVIVEYDGTGFCSVTEFVDAEFADDVKAIVTDWLSTHELAYNHHRALAKAAARVAKIKGGNLEMKNTVEFSKYYGMELAAANAAELANNLPSAAAHYRNALDNLEWEIASFEYEHQNLSKATSTQKKQRAEYAKALKAAKAAGDVEAVERYEAWIENLDATAANIVELPAEEAVRLAAREKAAAALAAKLSDLTGEPVNVQRKNFTPNAFCNKIREWAEAVIAAEEPKTVEATIRTADRDAAEAAMFFLLDLLGEDEFVGYDTTDDGYTVYFGTNITAATFAKIRDYVNAHGLNATFAA